MRQSYAENHKIERRHSILTFFTRFFAAVAAVVIVSLCASAYFSQQDEFQRLAREKRKLERERNLLFQEYESLKGLDDIAESHEYIERVARDYLGMAMPGDLVIIID